MFAFDCRVGVRRCLRRLSARPPKRVGTGGINQLRWAAGVGRDRRTGSPFLRRPMKWSGNETKIRYSGWNEKENGDCKTELAAGTIVELKQEPALITDPNSDAATEKGVESVEKKFILALTLVRARRVMELHPAESIIMKDLGPNSQSSSNNPPPKVDRGPNYEKGILQARLEYVRSLLQIEIDRPGPTPDVRLALESELMKLEPKMKSMEGKMTELLPRPIALSPQTKKSKRIKRSAAPVVKPAQTTNSENANDSDFVFPKKTMKNPPVTEKNDINTNNSFEVLDAVMTDVEEVTPAFKSKPIFMKIFDSYNLVLQDLHRNFPTATNTHAKGYIKIEAQNEKDHDEITKYLKDKNLEFYTIEPPITRPLKLVIKGQPVDIDPEDIKNDLISKGIKIVKTTQLKRFVSKTPLPIYMIEIERDENVNDIFQVRSCLYMQIKIDPFKKGNRITQCFNCNYFHHATSNCNMKTRCLKCGENHRTGMCVIKEKIVDPLCINCKAKGHLASSIKCPLFPKPRKTKEKSPDNNQKQNLNSTPVIPGLLYSQVLNSNFKHQMSAPGFAPSASDSTENSKNNALNKETLNVSQNVPGEFGLFQAINEMQTIFTLFPSLLSEMEKSSKCTDPTEKLQCLLRVICPTPNTV
ncbi:uncharacterized protein TNCV_3091881 [Trichonephila clavipes]|nr:uncharacterized protein TNCV_3091881 [Trichonephila clavipes]